jgi:predicted TIM-barrel fold metal-dependent hydrolase
MNRRHFLRAAAISSVAMGGPLRSGGSLLAQGALSHPGRIDVHHHCRLPFLPAPIAYGAIRPHPLRPAHNHDRTEQARTLARSANESIAAMVQAHPGRFGFFAMLPLADTDGSLREIEYAFDTLDADGVLMNSSAGNMWPGDPSQMPVFEELNRRRTTVFLHPNSANLFCCTNPPGVPNSVAEFDNDRLSRHQLHS